MRLIAAILVLVALLGVVSVTVTPAVACGGMLTITPPPFDPPPVDAPAAVDPFDNSDIDEVIL